MEKTIYKDNTREITVDAGFVVVNAAKRHTAKMPIEVTPVDAQVSSTIKDRGEDPANWRYIRAANTCAGPGKGFVHFCLPQVAAEALLAANAEYEAERAAYRANPANADRRRVDDLFAEAERLADYPDQYYAMQAKAQKAFEAWRKNYPEQAKAEQKSELENLARKAEADAKDALVYDADGSITSDMQEERAAEYRAKAADYRAQAEAL